MSAQPKSLVPVPLPWQAPARGPRLAGAQADAPEVSIIVPALNEAENLPELARRIDAALAGRAYEILVVDDNSADHTPAVCRALARQYPLRLHVRLLPDAGLSGAVLHGMALARGRVLAVMDADLQHPPERLPDLLAEVEDAEAGCDFAIGSRYVPGGSTAETWGPLRRLNSKAATCLARPFAGATRDPMSGFFALRRETYEAACSTGRLTPLGYKIGLELMCKCRVRAVAEVPIHFDARTRGRSKLTLAQQFKFLEHLSRLYDFCYPRLSPAAKFGVVTALTWFVGLGAYLTLALWWTGPALAAAASYPLGLLTAAVFHARYVRTQRAFLGTPRPWLAFAACAACEWATCAAVSAWVALRVLSPGAAEMFILTFGCATIARYVMRKELLLDARAPRRII